MSIKIKAIERKLKFQAGEQGKYEYRYVMQADLYNPNFAYPLATGHEHIKRSVEN